MSGEPGFDFVGVWAVILAAGLFLYVALDGFDLGVGMLHGISRSATERNLIMNSIAPVWDGNETWLVLGGIGLFAAFPLAFAIIIPALYFPILIMLMALIFRGLAFEFRYRDAEHRSLWDHGFGWGSLIATLAQGMMLGAFIQGFRVEGRDFVGGPLDWLSPFSVFTGLALTAGYCLLGACWLIIKLEGALQDWARRMAKISLIAVLIGILVVSLWTPMISADVAARWFSWPNLLYLSPVPIATALIALWAWYALLQRREWAPFMAALMLFALAYGGIAISLWPMIVPHHYSLWQAAASPSSQGFLAIGTLLLLPIVIMYTGWSYWVFRGKIRGDIGYH